MAYPSSQEIIACSIPPLTKKTAMVPSVPLAHGPSPVLYRTRSPCSKPIIVRPSTERPTPGPMHRAWGAPKTPLAVKVGAMLVHVRGVEPVEAVVTVGRYMASLALDLEGFGV